MDRIEGGAVLPITEFWLGGGRSGHTAEQSGRPVSQFDLDASNRLQETGWRINRYVLDVASAAFAAGHPVMQFDPWQGPKVPARLEGDEWAALTSEEKRKAAIGRKEGRKKAEAWRTQVATTASLLSAARGDVDNPSLYLPVGHDARLRRYYRVSTGPGPQGSGLAKALLHFDEGVKLGSAGLYWLAVRAGTAAGLDKLTHDARAQWASDNTEALLASARNPLETDFWWRDRDDPWALLATAHELHLALSSSSPGEFHSHLPVNVDGTCNGLQHLSALGLDPIGALATNLSDSTERQDIYERVAAVVRARVAADVDAGLDVAKVWHGKVTRSTVKRGCMTTAYGVTARGMRDQLIEDGEVPEDAEDESAAAGYMRDVMWDAIGQVVVAARNVMDWLQTTASELGKANVPFRWTTPAGSIIQQSYRPWVARRPLTAFGQLVVSTAVDKSSLKVRKQALAAAPNYVHSFDAAHMARTINSGHAQGITHWACIHDSYGTHAAHMDKLNRTLRTEFAAIYSEDWLMKTYQEVRAQAPGVKINRPPVRGEFDIGQVVRSPWFFA